ncbi:hypothetical protein PEBR_42966 [Penicillium brasilianum]|uniref:Uncharacterized protein n=1 Tax=Penicillium brasilianum TaxID=104259 RepID=A0A1S9R8L4_PENBI|nr:hypothetical protein PEBR_42966 [Penicillium brasilianum]
MPDLGGPAEKDPRPRFSSGEEHQQTRNRANSKSVFPLDVCLAGHATLINWANLLAGPNPPQDRFIDQSLHSKANFAVSQWLWPLLPWPDWDFRFRPPPPPAESGAHQQRWRPPLGQPLLRPPFLPPLRLLPLLSPELL